MIVAAPLIMASAVGSAYLSHEGRLGLTIGMVGAGCMFTLWAGLVPLEKR